ncbi:MAG: LamG domain-containing protein [Deltaproteobacteria bacterium]|nr:LamG domain-containing protein [Deltaproteobacteria bacterium]
MSELSSNSRPGTRRFAVRFLSALVLVLGGLFLTYPLTAGAGSGSLAFFINDPDDYDYGHQLALPPTFGEAEFTFELWIRPDDSFPVGPTTSGAAQRTNWSDSDEEPYSGGGWWFSGNFLLDGHNNGVFEDGTFSLQFYGGGRVRWLFGDGEFAGPGGHWSVGAFPATTTPSLLDGAWHQITLVRRWLAETQAQLELWVDGALVATEVSSARTDMGFWWDSWVSFPLEQEGWFWAVEKQAAIGVLSQYEDYKGPIDEVRFWDRAKTPQEIASDWNRPVTGSETGLVGWFPMNEGSGSTTCDALGASGCINLVNPMVGVWSSDQAPLGGAIFADGFESGNTSAWTAQVP